jgi:hypothetical protein
MAEQKQKTMKAKTKAKSKAKAKAGRSPESLSATAPSAPVNLELRRPEPAMVQLGQDSIKRFAGDWNEQRVKSVLADVASRKRPIESALLDLFAGARDAVDKSLGEALDRSNAELKLDKQYRDQLRAERNTSRSARARKGEVRVKGQVIHPKTGEPVAGVVVEAIDKDVRQHDLLGVVITDTEGRFEIAFDAKAYKESGEKEPEIMLSVGLDRKRKLYVADQPVTFVENKPEAVTITLPESHAVAIDSLTVGRGQANIGRRRTKSGEALLRREMEQRFLNATGNAALSLLGSGISLLEARLKKR